MIVMDLKLDNFCAFNNFHINMSYPKKIVNSSIENEHLKNYDNFRYKKLNIIMGANASGKTSLGKMLMSIFNFIYRKEVARLEDRRTDKSRPATFSIDFIPGENEMYRVEVEIPLMEKEDISIDDIEIRIKRETIHKLDNYEKCSERLALSNDGLKLSDIPMFGWFFTYPLESNRARNIKASDIDDEAFLEIMKAILMTLDNSIQDVRRIEGVEKAFAIEMCHESLLVQDGELVKKDVLSSGTISGLDIAKLVYSIIRHRNGFYYCDEKFSYIHSEIEKALLSIMISSLGENEQLFFTTHNLEIADMDLPKHSYNMLKKEADFCKTKITCINASQRMKKNTESFKNAIDNDLFGASPNLSLLSDLEAVQN